ncbi:Ureidoglycolate hydrolase [Ascosphaera apis ARSEF 7405]|uniref:Ureidoglycolate hydrolase n=1 Tax=Ascosphaera apis ARSEF 7405 TaxID=392613 RepID=A0A167YXQ5_9EURO|nr:Ureidoglycolate hydrolase [Ascosphaera apis ARSEF 7405]
MAPPHLISHESLTITPDFLTADGFAPFGDVVACPLPANINQIPSLTELPKNSRIPAVANQNTALKYSAISKSEDNYERKGRKPATPQMTLFSCFPRKLRPDKGKNIFDVRILERHPYTTQSFLPMGLSSGDDAPSYFLVIVAPTLEGQTAPAKVKDEHGIEQDTVVQNPPDLKNIKAFVARGNQGVTYGAGTWHAPMVVLGTERVDFAVTQFANGIANDDCQEVTFEGGIVVEAQPAEPKLWSPRRERSRL